MTERNYDCPAYKELRREIYKRDKRTCQWPNCGSHKRLRVHHIRTWSEYPALRYTVGNCILLCKDHHDSIWSKESMYERLFFQIIHIKAKLHDNNPRQPSKTKRVESDDRREVPTTRRRKRRKASFAKRYAAAKRKVRRRRR